MSGHWGLVGAFDVCSEAYLEAHYSSPFTYGCVSFEDSPYGFTNDIAAAPTLIPYLIDATTLQIEYRPDLAVSMASGALSGALIGMDDSTIVTGDATNASLYVVSRSGIDIAVSGAQQVATISGFGGATVARIDSSHFVRAYAVTGGWTLEVLSVSGSTISLVHTEIIAGLQTATVDPSGLPSPMSNSFLPFHYDGAGTLYAYGSSVGSTTLTGPAILALPFSIGGGIGGAITLTTRAKDAQNINFGGTPPAKSGSSECLLLASTGYQFPFYDDGTNMHYGTLTSVGISFNMLGDGGDLDTPQGDYLTGNVVEFPPGTTVNSGPALVSQSGVSLSYAPITPVFQCPQFESEPLDGQRHGSNLGAMVVGAGPGILVAYKW